MQIYLVSTWMANYVPLNIAISKVTEIDLRMCFMWQWKWTRADFVYKEQHFAVENHHNDFQTSRCNSPHWSIGNILKFKINIVNKTSSTWWRFIYDNFV